jgi:hypothetical protein
MGGYRNESGVGWGDGEDLGCQLGFGLAAVKYWYGTWVISGG